MPEIIKNTNRHPLSKRRFPSVLARCCSTAREARHTVAAPTSIMTRTQQAPASSGRGGAKRKFTQAWGVVAAPKRAKPGKATAPSPVPNDAPPNDARPQRGEATAVLGQWGNVVAILEKVDAVKAFGNNENHGSCGVQAIAKAVWPDTITHGFGPEAGLPCGRL